MHWVSYLAGSTCTAVILVVCVLVWLATFRKQGIKEHNERQREYEDAVLSQLIERTELESEQNRILTRLCEVVLLNSRIDTHA